MSVKREIVPSLFPWVVSTARLVLVLLGSLKQRNKKKKYIQLLNNLNFFIRLNKYKSVFFHHIPKLLFEKHSIRAGGVTTTPKCHVFTDLVTRVDLLFRRALHVVHSCRADLHQVEQPLPVLCLLWPLYVEGGGAKVCQALSQIDYL